MDINITNEQQVKLTLAPKTDAGRPAQLDGKPVWEVLSGNSTIVVADNGLSADLISSATPGVTEILIKADADLGDGYEQISELVRLNVEGATAKNFGLSLGVPTLKPVESGS